MIVLPFNHCHDSSRYCPSSSPSASCNDSASIFKRLSDTAFSFFSRFFQPHFLILNIRAFVARGKFFRPHRAKFYCTLTICLFFLAEANRQDLFLLYLMFSTPGNRLYDNAGIGTQSLSCQNIRALLCRMIFSALLTDNCQHIIREN